MCRTFFILAITLGAGCAGPMTSDQAELRNIKFSNRVPKSSPAQFVKAFDAFCIEPKSPSEREFVLRKASYVPLEPKRPGEPQVFLVDDRRPAIVVSDTLCSARALSRTGQTARLQSYIETKFHTARQLDADFSSLEIEQLWEIERPDPALIATERGYTIDGLTTFAVTMFRL